jgi:hypothetical protein
MAVCVCESRKSAATLVAWTLAYRGFSGGEVGVWSEQATGIAYTSQQSGLERDREFRLSVLFKFVGRNLTFVPQRWCLQQASTRALSL